MLRLGYILCVSPGAIRYTLSPPSIRIDGAMDRMPVVRCTHGMSIYGEARKVWQKRNVSLPITPCQWSNPPIVDKNWRRFVGGVEYLRNMRCLKLKTRIIGLLNSFQLPTVHMCNVHKIKILQRAENQLHFFFLRTPFFREAMMFLFFSWFKLNGVLMGFLTILIKHISRN